MWFGTILKLTENFEVSLCEKITIWLCRMIHKIEENDKT